MADYTILFSKGVISMAETTNLNIRIDKDLKERADAVFTEMGMNMTTAFNIFVRQTLRQGKIPFEIYTDPFYSESNMKVLRASVADMNAGRGIVRKTMEELETMEND
jgi:DNA-damage-inducible protein J